MPFIKKIPIGVRDALSACYPLNIKWDQTNNNEKGYPIRATMNTPIIARILPYLKMTLPLDGYPWEA